MPIVGRGAWKLVGGGTAIARATTNDVAQMIDLGTDAALVAGRYIPRWLAAAELGVDWALATHISHSDAYRMVVSLGANDLVLRAGVLRDDAGNPTTVPFYATLGYDRRW